MNVFEIAPTILTKKKQTEYEPTSDNTNVVL